MMSSIRVCSRIPSWALKNALEMGLFIRTNTVEGENEEDCILDCFLTKIFNNIGKDAGHILRSIFLEVYYATDKEYFSC